MNRYYEDKIRCPYCDELYDTGYYEGELYPDEAVGINANGGEFLSCTNCNEEFLVIPFINVSYSVYKKACTEKGEKCNYELIEGLEIKNEFGLCNKWKCKHCENEIFRKDGENPNE
jgi:hypothetical protein